MWALIRGKLWTLRKKSSLHSTRWRSQQYFAVFSLGDKRELQVPRLPASLYNGHLPPTGNYKRLNVDTAICLHIVLLAWFVVAHQTLGHIIFDFRYVLFSEIYKLSVNSIFEKITSNSRIGAKCAMLLMDTRWSHSSKHGVLLLTSTVLIIGVWMAKSK